MLARKVWTYSGASYSFVIPISMLRRLRNLYPRPQREIGTQLLDKLRTCCENHFLVNHVRIPRIDDLYPKLVAGHEFVRRINIIATVCLVVKIAFFLLGSAFHNLPSGHDRLQQLTIAVNSKF